MNKNRRILAIDDGPFKFGDEMTDIVGVISRGPSYLEAIMKDSVQVDGRDSTEKIITMIKSSRYLEQVNVIMLDGGAFGGFNVFDIFEINERLDIPVMTVTRRLPDHERIKKALSAHFEDWEERFAIISKGNIDELPVKRGKAYVKRAGLDIGRSKALLARFTVHGVIPEPLRMAHMVATILKKNICTGKA
ncbi:MAG: DUF99 family protein [Candidatus Thermoplasmatota archaeon]|jgi:hypothetical protein|nr:DUF99 family protein [Candidatus Thermoplasmatota archaeon]MDP7263928.1 DUF99 family protein [Candidatus Thermoplasmatota archaeon]